MISKTILLSLSTLLVCSCSNLLKIDVEGNVFTAEVLEVRIGDNLLVSPIDNLPLEIKYESRLQKNGTLDAFLKSGERTIRQVQSSYRFGQELRLRFDDVENEIDVNIVDADPLDVRSADVVRLDVVNLPDAINFTDVANLPDVVNPPDVANLPDVVNLPDVINRPDVVAPPDVVAGVCPAVLANEAGCENQGCDDCFVGDRCDFDCNNIACNQREMVCVDDTRCQIECDNRSCDDANIQCPEQGTCEIVCEDESCDGAEINCASGDCTISFAGRSGAGAVVNCGAGGCEIDCRDVTSCSNLVLNCGVGPCHAQCAEGISINNEGGSCDLDIESACR